MTKDIFLLAFGGTLPQNNINLIKRFRKLIDEKSDEADKIIIVDMAVTQNESKTGLIDYFASTGKEIIL